LIPIRVILACDENFKYIQFWEPVAQHWKQHHGLKPTLFFIGTNTATLNKTIGEVIQVNPIPGLPTSLIAQMIRLVAPSMFPNDVCIVSDIDMFVLDGGFFKRYTQSVPIGHFVSLNRYPHSMNRVSICYQIALGSTFGRIFGCDGSLQSMTRCVQSWASVSTAWGEDEKLLTRVIKQWSGSNSGQWHHTHVPGLWGTDTNNQRTISRYLRNGAFDEIKLKQHHYIEFEPPRPITTNLEQTKHILATAMPGYIFPTITYNGHDTGPSRHPWEQKKHPRQQRGRRGLLKRRRAASRVPSRSRSIKPARPRSSSVRKVLRRL